MILDSRGNALDAFDNWWEAKRTMKRIISQEPEAAEEIVLIAYDDKGMALQAFTWGNINEP